MTKEEITIITDGCCKGNPGPGGYAAIIVRGGCSTFISGAAGQTTNNRCELLAIIEGIRAALAMIPPGTPLPDLCIISDSQYAGYVVQQDWRAKKLKPSSKDAPNKDLILAMQEVLEPYTQEGGPVVEFRWVRGHSGHELNEEADRLANEAVNKLITGITPTKRTSSSKPYEEPTPEPSLEEELESLRPLKIPQYKLRQIPTRK